MAIGAAPKMLVQAPTIDPRDYGLLSTVEARYDEADVHWRNGARWSDICGLGGTTFDPFCLGGSPSGPADKAANVTVNHFAATPFTTVAEVDCSPVGYSQEEQRARAVDALTRTEPYQVENSFWTGSAGGQTANIVYPHLAANAAVLDGSSGLPIATLQCAATAVTGTTVLDITEGIGRLEAAFMALAPTMGKGVIHLPSILAEALFYNHVAEVEGTVIRTRLGNKIAVGAGYPGTGPDGSRTSNAVWVYMTGPIFAYRGSPQTFAFREMLDREDNTLKTIVERPWLLGYSCCALPAVLISVGGDVTGQPLSAF
jgi:hypothetical protein